MRRTPFPGNANGVWNNLVDAMGTRSARANGRADAQLFGVVPDPNELGRPGGLRAAARRGGRSSSRASRRRRPSYFANRVMVFLTSCDERRYGQWEHTSWWDFVGAESKSEEYQKVVARGLTRILVAAKETVASTRTIGNMAEAFVMNIMQRGNDGAPDRVLNAPTNEAWIDPWVAHLRELGVPFHVGQTVEALEVRRGRVVAARARDRRGRRRRDRRRLVRLRDAGRARAAAVVAARARRRPGARGDARAPGRLDERHPVLPAAARSRSPRGHVTFVDAPWALTALTQGAVLGRPRLRARLRRRQRSSTACRSTSPTGTRPGSSTASRRSSARARRSRTRSGRRSRRTSRTPARA